MQVKPESPANGNICWALRLCYAIVEAETLRAAAVFILERQKKEKRAGLFLAAGAVSLSFAACRQKRGSRHLYSFRAAAGIRGSFPDA